MLYITNNSIKHQSFIYAQWSNNSIEHKSFVCTHFLNVRDRILSSAMTPGQSGPGNNGNEEVLHIPQSSRAGASPSNCLVSYAGYFGVGVLLLCRDAVSVFYSPANQAVIFLNKWYYDKASDWVSRFFFWLSICCGTEEILCLSNQIFLIMLSEKKKEHKVSLTDKTNYFVLFFFLLCTWFLKVHFKF